MVFRRWHFQLWSPSGYWWPLLLAIQIFLEDSLPTFEYSAFRNYFPNISPKILCENRDSWVATLTNITNTHKHLQTLTNTYKHLQTQNWRKAAEVRTNQTIQSICLSVCPPHSLTGHTCGRQIILETDSTFYTIPAIIHSTLYMPYLLLYTAHFIS